MRIFQISRKKPSAQSGMQRSWQRSPWQMTGVWPWPRGSVMKYTMISYNIWYIKYNFIYSIYTESTFSDAESEDPPALVTFSPSVTTNITNPLNGEQVEVRRDIPGFILNENFGINYELSNSKFVGTVLTSTMLQTKSRGLDTNIIEIKTWQFSPSGASVVRIWLM